MDRDNYNAVENFVRRYYDPSGTVKTEIQPYAYPVSFTDLLQGTSQTGTIQVAANADFVVTNIRFRAVETNDGIANNPLIDLLLTDAGSQQQLTADRVPITTAAGVIVQANDAGVLPYPRIISGRSQVLVQVFNVSDLLASPLDYIQVTVSLAGVLVRQF